MDDFDGQLQELALAAQQHIGTFEERRFLMQLWGKVYRSGRLYRPARTRISGNYEDIYQDAVYRLMLYSLRNIHKYDPHRGTVMAWLNVALDRRFIQEAIEAEQKHSQQRLNPSPKDGSDVIDPLDTLSNEKPAPSLLELIKQCLREDCDGLFGQRRMQKYPHVNFRDVALRYLEGESLRDLAREFNVEKYSSLPSFYQRSLEKFAPVIRQYCETHSS